MGELFAVETSIAEKTVFVGIVDFRVVAEEGGGNWGDWGGSIFNVQGNLLVNEDEDGNPTSTRCPRSLRLPCTTICSFVL
jgi:hypothetical protein